MSVEVLNFLSESTDFDADQEGGEGEDCEIRSVGFASDSYLSKYRDKFERLSKSEMIRLVVLARTGDVDARNRIVQHNLGLALKGAQQLIAMAQNAVRKNGGVGLDMEDLVQEATIGLMSAAEKWDFDRGAFSTCAVWWVRQAVYRAIQNSGALMRVPIAEQALRTKVFRVRDDLAVALGRDPLPAEIAQELDWPLKTVSGVLRRNSGPVLALDHSLGGDTDGVGATLLDVLSDTSPQPEEQLLSREAVTEVKLVLRWILHKISILDIADRDKEIFCRRLGLTQNGESATQAVLAKEYCITSSAVGQSFHRVYAKIVSQGELTRDELAVLEILKDGVGRTCAVNERSKSVSGNSRQAPAENVKLQLVDEDVLKQGVPTIDSTKRGGRGSTFMPAKLAVSKTASSTTPRLEKKHNSCLSKIVHDEISTSRTGEQARVVAVVCRVVGDYYGVSEKDLIGGGRAADAMIAIARRVAMYLLLNEEGLKKSVVAKAFSQHPVGLGQALGKFKETMSLSTETALEKLVPRYREMLSSSQSEA